MSAFSHSRSQISILLYAQIKKKRVTPVAALVVRGEAVKFNPLRSLFSKAYDMFWFRNQALS